VRVRLPQDSPCKDKVIKDQILSKLEKKLLSHEVCNNFPCKIFKPQLRCRFRKEKGEKRKEEGERTVSVYFDIELNQKVISTSKFCNDTCMKCQMEERLQKVIAALRTLTDNSKLNVTVDDQTFTIAKKSLRVTKDSGDHCSTKTRRKTKRLGKSK